MERAVIYAIIYIVQGLIAYYYLEHMFKKINTRTSTVICYFITYFFQYITFFLNIVMLNILMFLIMNFILIFSCYKINLFYSLFHAIIMTSLMSLSEFLVLNVIGGLLNPITDILDFGYPLIFMYIITTKFLYWLFLYIITKITDFSNKYIFVNKATIILTLFPIVSFIITAGLYIICGSNNLTRLSEYLLFGLSVSLIFSNIFIIWFYDYTVSQQELLTKLKIDYQHDKDTENYHKLVTQHDENQKILIHDIKNHLQALYALNKDGQHDAVSSYISRLLNTTALTRTYEPTNSRNLNLLLARYITICEEKNIRFNIDAKNTDISYMKLDETTSLFCNLIDNAIEASEGTKNAHIDLSIQDGNNKQHTVITTVNSCKAPPVKDKKRYRSSKPDLYMHGLGTHSVDRIIQKYKGDTESYYVEESNEFHVVVLLRKGAL